jgi:uncharacterized protein
VLAAGPTFNCAKATGEVEKLICGDSSLIALDRKLDAVYRAAAAKARGKLVSQLRVEQRGWVKGRNDCWKANGQQTWITATWTVDTVRACVEAQYRQRAAELQAVWRLLPPRTLAYACQGNPANQVVASYYDSDPPTIRLERGDRTATIWRVGTSVPEKYEGQNVSLTRQSSQLMVNWLNPGTGQSEELKCKVL